MRKFLIMLPLFGMIAACSDNETLEQKGSEAGAAADKAIVSAGDRIAAERNDLKMRTEAVREKARGVQQDVKEDLNKAEKAVDAAEAELKK